MIVSLVFMVDKKCRCRFEWGRVVLSKGLPLFWFCYECGKESPFIHQEEGEQSVVSDEGRERFEKTRP